MYKLISWDERSLSYRPVVDEKGLQVASFSKFDCIEALRRWPEAKLYDCIEGEILDTDKPPQSEIRRIR